MAQWYYVDKNQQRVGPMDASVLVDALRHGQLHLSSMVWQENMPAWQPLSMHLDAIGVPESLRVRKPVKSSNAGIWVVVLLVAGFVGIAILGIMIAIALPAYQDYTVRAKVMEGLNTAASAKLAVAETRLNTGKWPTSNTEAGLTITSSNIVSEITITSAQDIRITYSSAVREISGETLMLRADVDVDGVVRWECNAAGSYKLGGEPGTLPAKYAPAACRP
jgi:type IV pilus assembly protein PilA